MQVGKSKRQVSSQESVPDLTNDQDPIALLTHQHREVDALFEQMNTASAKSYRTKEKIAKMIGLKVLFHTKLEQKIFYPMAREFIPDLIAESLEEHEIIKMELKRFMSTKGDDFSFKAKTTVLKELINHHVQEEENQMFPHVRENCDKEQLAEIGAKIAQETENDQSQKKSSGAAESRLKIGMEKKRKSA